MEIRKKKKGEEQVIRLLRVSLLLLQDSPQVILIDTVCSIGEAKLHARGIPQEQPAGDTRRCV
jgi:hypothetical protein